MSTPSNLKCLFSYELSLRVDNRRHADTSYRFIAILTTTQRQIRITTIRMRGTL
jgi:hypothetical protein